MADNKEYKYDVAISFAEEDRNAALALALALEIAGFIKVYYYPQKRAETWGANLETTLFNIYAVEARYAVVLLSAHYFKKEKVYTKIEFNAIGKRLNQTLETIYMLPVKLDNGLKYSMHSLLNGKAYIEWDYNPKEIALTLKELFGKKADTITRAKKLINSNYSGSNNTQQITNSTIIGDVAMGNVYKDSTVTINFFKK